MRLDKESRSEEKSTEYHHVHMNTDGVADWEPIRRGPIEIQSMAMVRLYRPLQLGFMKASECCQRE